ncbi:MAG: OadG family protein [Planctomycetes bacterium]|nr:OadG family protein [Planctomycetota bacterium]
MGDYFLNILSGFGMLLGGFSKVFFVLSVVIACTSVLVKHIIPWADEKWPEPNAPLKKAAQRTNSEDSVISGDELAVITSAIVQATGGKGTPQNISKI